MGRTTGGTGSQRMNTRPLLPGRHTSAIPEWMAWPREGSLIDRSETFFSNNGPFLMISALYIIGCLLSFQYGFHYAIDRHYKGARGYITPVGRGCGVCLDFNCALLLLPMCRALLTWLRTTRMAVVIPFDESIGGHRVIAFVICFLTLIHGGGQAVNYYLYYTMTPGIFGLKSVFWTGIALTVALFAIVGTSMDCMRRRRKFEVFYYTHYLFLAFYPLLCIHGLRHGKPTCWMFIIVPMCMYIVDRMYRTCSSFSVKTTMAVVEVRSAKVLHIAVKKPFEYKAGQYCELRVPSVSGSEWHPFTISSSPLGQFMEFDIKAAGNWTNELYRQASEGLSSTTMSGGAGEGVDSPITGGAIHVKGPFGAPAEHFNQFDDLVLISSGIGATPFASVCKNVVAERRERNIGGDSASAEGTLASLAAHAEAAESKAGRRSASRASGASRPSVTSRHLPSPGGARGRGDSAAPYMVAPNLPFDWKHPAWPFSGQCGCSPLRVALESHPSREQVRMKGLSRDGAPLPVGPPSAEESLGALPNLTAAGAVLGVGSWWLAAQRYLRTVTAQMILIALWMMTATMSIVVLISNSEYYLTCILIDKLHGSAGQPNWATDLETASESIFLFVSVLVLVSILVDIKCVGCSRFWKIQCLRRQTLMVLPGVLILLIFNCLQSFNVWRPVNSIHYAIQSVSKLMLIVPLVVRVHHLTHFVKLTGHLSKDTRRIRSVRFYWVNRHADAQEWLLPDIVRMERADADGLFSFHVYVTRGKGDIDARWDDYPLRHGVETGRPKWNTIFKRLHDHYPPGSVVGVFFCGTPALAKVLQQVCTTCSSSNVLFRFKKENF